MAKVEKTEEEWKNELDPEKFAICRLGGTERAFTGKYWDTKTPGTYVCAACRRPLFDSSTKYDSGSGWPSFYAPVEAEAVTEHEDHKYGMRNYSDRKSTRLNSSHSTLSRMPSSA